MTIFRVDDTVNLCASIVDFCGTNLLLLNHDINASVSPTLCNINSAIPNGCLFLSGRTLEFQWTNASGSVNKHTCNNIIKLKTLGTATTNSNGVASLLYKITQNDLDLYTANSSTFDLKVCINDTNTLSTNNSHTRKEYQVDSIIIEQGTHLECVSGVCTKIVGIRTDTCVTEGSTTECTLLTPTHIIKYNIGDWEYANLLEKYIVDFSNVLAPLVPKTNPDITYIKTEYNNIENCIDVYVAYTGTSPTSYIHSPYATVPGELELTDYGMLLLIVLSVALSILLFTIVAVALAAGGPVTWTILAYLIVALGLFLVSAYNIYHIISTSRTATQIAENVKISLSQDNSLTTTKDELLNLCANNKITKIDYYKSLKEVNVVYANKAKAEFPLIEIKSEFDTFKVCADTLITNFNPDDNCGTLLNNMNSCALSLISKIQSEKGTKYTSGTYIPPSCNSHLVKEVCDASSICIWSYGECISKKSCIIVNPLDGTCTLSTDNLWKGMPYVIGVGLLGAVTFMYAPGVINVIGSGISEWSKTLNTKPTNEESIKSTQKKSTYTK